MDFSQDFIERILTILVTSVIAGFLVPFVLKIIDDRKHWEQRRIDERKQREQKVFEAELARQNKVIESQVQLLENLSELLWEYQLSAIAVTYYHSFGDQDLYAAAIKNYDKKVATLLGEIRAEISKALRLTSPETYEKLKDLYYEKLVDGLDKDLRALREGKKDDWHAINQFAVFELSETVDNVLSDLAKELKLQGAHSE